MPITRNHKLHPIRIAIGIITGIIVLSVAIALYHHNHTPPANSIPSTQNVRPNSGQ